MQSSANSQELYLACWSGKRVEAVRLLKELGGKVDRIWVCKIMREVCEHDWLDILRQFVEEYGYNPAEIRDKNQQTLLHYSCQQGSIDTLKYLIDKCLNLEVRDKGGWSPLHVAAQRGHVNVIKILIHHGAKPTTRDVFVLIEKSDRIPEQHVLEVLDKSNMPDDVVHIACKEKKSTVLNFLLAKVRCDPNVKNSNGNTPIQLTTNPEIVHTLIEYGASISSATVVGWLHKASNVTKTLVALVRALTHNDSNMKTDDGDTVLHLLCEQSVNLQHHQCRNILNFLLHETKCDPNSKNSRGQTPIELTSDENIITQLIRSNAMTTSHVMFKLIIAKNIKQLEAVELFHVALQNSTWKPDDRTTNGDSAIHLACKVNNHIMVEYLLSKAKCDPNSQNEDKKTPIWFTMNPKIIQNLREYGASISSALIRDWLSDSNGKVLNVIEVLVDSDPNWKTTDGDTILHLVCQQSKPDFLSIISYLLSEVHSDPNAKNSAGETPLDLTTHPLITIKLVEYGAPLCISSLSSVTTLRWLGMLNYNNKLELVRILVQNNPNEKTSDGYTLLHLICKHFSNSYYQYGKDIIHYLLSNAKCNPNVEDSFGQTPIQLATHFDIIEELVCYGANTSTKDVFILLNNRCSLELLKVCVKSTTWKPNDIVNDNTALHVACITDQPTIVSFLLSEASCDPNMINSSGNTPIQLISNMEIIHKLIQHGAVIGPEVVLRTKNTETQIVKILKLATKFSKCCTWSPDDVHSNGDTVLHLACKADRPTVVKFLLSNSYFLCNPNVKNSDGITALEMTANPEIIKDLIRHGAKTSAMFKTHRKTLGTSKPLQPPVKVFVVGDPSAGKSTLTAALKKETLFGRSKVTNVDEKTVGVVPHDFKSKKYGHVTVYDFAGHREFYHSHAALLQTAVQYSAPIFLLVVNLCNSNNDIRESILYWISFLENQCMFVNGKPHIVVVGSHADVLKSRKEELKEKTEFINSLQCKYFINLLYAGFVAMDCQYNESHGMTDLRYIMVNSCQSLRPKEQIPFNAHCFHVYLLDTFKESTTITLNSVHDNIKHHQLRVTDSEEDVLSFLPQSIGAIYKICNELNDRGHILFMKNPRDVENSWIIIDKTALLSEVTGTIFAPEDFKEHKQLASNTGVVSFKKISECFPNHDPNMLVGFLTHLEFCHEVSDQELYTVIREQYSPSDTEHYYLFPALILQNIPHGTWDENSTFDNYFGWMMQCISPTHFFTSRLLQVLLLRLAFSLALAKSSEESNKHSPSIQRKCSIWRNGIFWGNRFGVETLVEVQEGNKVLVILIRNSIHHLVKSNEVRSQVAKIVVHCIKQFCPRVEYTESFIDPSTITKYPLNPVSELNCYSIQETAKAVTFTSFTNPSVVSLNGLTIPLNKLLVFDPYADLGISLLQTLYNKQAYHVSDQYLTQFAQRTSSRADFFMEILGSTPKHGESSNSSYSLLQELRKWRHGCDGTYHCLRQKLDVVSIFTGRNVLVSLHTY